MKKIITLSLLLVTFSSFVCADTFDASLVTQQNNSTNGKWKFTLNPIKLAWDGAKRTLGVSTSAVKLAYHGLSSNRGAAINDIKKIARELGLGLTDAFILYLEYIVFSKFILSSVNISVEKFCNSCNGGLRGFLTWILGTKPRPIVCDCCNFLYKLKENISYKL